MMCCSLGMVFLSVSESTDVGVELLSSAGQSVSDDLNVVQYLPSSTTDQEIAQQLEQEAKEFQLAQDAHLAEQLQLKENSYRIPR